MSQKGGMLQKITAMLKGREMLLHMPDEEEQTTFSLQIGRKQYGPKNIHQPDEIERLLDFAETFRVKLEQRGYKLDKWKR